MTHMHQYTILQTSHIMSHLIIIKVTEIIYFFKETRNLVMLINLSKAHTY